MAFNFDNAVGSEQTQNRMFKQGVKYAFFKADDKRPITFRLLPAFPEHDGQLTDEDKAGSYVPAVTLVGGRPVIADWIFALKVSRSYQKGANPIVSRRTIVELNSDGTVVEQEDPLSQLHAFIRANDAEWGYVAKDVGEWGSKDRVVAKLPYCKPEYVMNVLTLDDDRPGVKIGVISSGMAIACLISQREGHEGLAIRQRDEDIPQERIDANPSVVFQYGDITDPNSAPVFKYAKSLSDDGGKKVYTITLSAILDPSTGRKRVERMGLTTDHMAGRVDLAHPETYVNIPTPEEQVSQIVSRCCGRSPTGVHEYGLLRAALPDYTSLIPEPPMAPGAVNQVQGFTPQTQAQAAPQEQPVVQQATMDPEAQVVKTTTTAPENARQSVHTTHTFKPAATVSAQPRQTQPQAKQAAPVFRPASSVAGAAGAAARAASQPKPQPKPQPEPEAAFEADDSVPADGPVEGVPGEEFSEDDWMAKYSGGK